MKCIECGHQTQEEKEDRELKLGLPYHVVARDNSVHVCPNCSARYPSLVAPQVTMESIASWIARRPGRLHGSEIRFVRNALGWSQELLGRRLGVAPETISRWENLKKPVGYQSELAIRFLVLAGSEIADALDSGSDLPAEVHVTGQQDVRAAG